jgi:hypothetical protein
MEVLVAYVRESMPDGDYRDWKEVETWVNGIADALSQSTTTTSTRQ